MAGIQLFAGIKRNRAHKVCSDHMNLCEGMY